MAYSSDPAWPVSSARAETEPAKPIAERSASASANRAFWDRFIVGVRFSHPDQPQPTHGSNNWVRLRMPIGAVTAYREQGRRGPNGACSIFLRLTGGAGKVAFDALCTELPQIEAELGASLEASWKGGDEVGTISFAQPLETGDEELQLAWLLKNADPFVSALRPRLSAFG